eukprot:9489484-Pyramimonas_sp.AAC.1
MSPLSGAGVHARRHRCGVLRCQQGGDGRVARAAAGTSARGTHESTPPTHESTPPTHESTPPTHEIRASGDFTDWSKDFTGLSGDLSSLRQVEEEEAKSRRVTEMELAACESAREGSAEEKQRQREKEAAELASLKHFAETAGAKCAPSPCDRVGGPFYTPPSPS